MRLLFVAVLFISAFTSKRETPWPDYLGGPDRNHYSDLTEIDTLNVHQLTTAWVYHSRDSGQIQCNPIIVDDVLYGVTATAQPFALNAGTGEELWRVADSVETKWYATSRGVSYWQNGNDKRIFYTHESWLIAVNAATGKPITSFGHEGRVHWALGSERWQRSDL